MRPIITLLTDFGEGSPYVAEMKAAALAICRDVVLVDITHRIGPQNVREGAIVLSRTAPQFPPGAIHVAVVDPGVGTDRKILCARLGSHWCIGPDNGLWSRAAMALPPTSLVSLESPRHRASAASSTFHGRDIMAPAAAYLALGREASQLGAPMERLAMLDWRKPSVEQGRVEGEIEYIDSFGNLVTNIPIDALEQAGLDVSACAFVEGISIPRISRTYGESAAGNVVALFGSAGHLEIAVVNGSAAERLSLGVADPVVVKRGGPPG